MNREPGFTGQVGASRQSLWRHDRPLRHIGPEIAHCWAHAAAIVVHEEEGG